MFHRSNSLEFSGLAHFLHKQMSEDENGVISGVSTCFRALSGSKMCDILLLDTDKVGRHERVISGVYLLVWGL